MTSQRKPETPPQSVLDPLWSPPLRLLPDQVVPDLSEADMREISLDELEARETDEAAPLSPPLPWEIDPDDDIPF